jgi:hypothetical protein
MPIPYVGKPIIPAPSKKYDFFYPGRIDKYKNYKKYSYLIANNPNLILTTTYLLNIITSTLHPFHFFVYLWIKNTTSLLRQNFMFATSSQK